MTRKSSGRRSRDEWNKLEQQLQAAEQGRRFSDDARRASDIINGHLTADDHNIQRWVAIRLSDGGSDGTLYDTKADAVRHQLDEYQCVYVCIPPTGTSPAQMQAYLDIHRQMYDAGARMVDPDAPTGGPQYIPPVMLEQHNGQRRSVGLPNLRRPHF